MHIRSCCAGDYRRLLRPQDALGQAMPRCRAFPLKTSLSAGFFGKSSSGLLKTIKSAEPTSLFQC